MRGNRATQKSGLDEVVSFFHLRGSDVFHLFPPCFTPFPLTLRVGPTHPHPLLNIFFPSSQQCLNHPTELGPPPCVFANLPSLCVVCHFVNVYPTPPFFFCTSRFFHPAYPRLVPLPVRPSVRPLSDTCFASVMVDPSPILRAFQEDSTLDIPMFHLCRHWFIYHRYDCDAM
jgi:hypothetical protein